jgi:hypothetical protein
MVVPSIIRRGILLGALLLTATAPALAQGVGAIRGTVTDNSGAVLPGASGILTAAQGGLGGNQERVSDTRGAYEFLRLPPGTYTVRAELAGFRPIVQPNVAVNADATARADLRLQIGAIEEAITVTGTPPLLDTTNALKQTVLTKEEQQALPNRTDVWSMARVIPGVVVSKIDVGGSDARNASGIAVRGSGTENKYMVDGMDVSSPSGTATIANFYLDPFSYEEASFQAGAGSAENSSGGLNMNMVTRSGTNVLHGGFKANWTPPAWANTRNYSDALRNDLLAAVPQRVRERNPDLEPGNDIQDMTDVGGWLAGPIKKDKLWFAATWHDQRMSQYILGAYNPDGSQGLDTNALWNVTGKVSWQITRSAQLSYFNNTQYKLNGRFAGNQRATFNEDRATQYVFKYPTVNQLKFTAPFGSSSAFDVTYSRFRSDNAFTPQSGVAVGDIPTFDTVTLVAGVALPTTCPGTSCSGYYTTPLYREQVRANYTIGKGSHDIRMGYEFVDITRDTRAWSINDISADYANGLPVAASTYTMPTAEVPFPSDLPVWFSYRAREHGAFVQDRWSIGSRLVVNLGLRYETNNSWEPPACAPSSRFYAGQCFEQTTAPSFGNFAPRSSVVWDMRGDGRTVLKFTANRYNQPISVQAISNIHPITAPSDTRQWLPQSRCAEAGVLGCDRNGDLIPQLSELGPSPGYVFAGVNARYADDIDRETVNEYTAEFQRELPQGIVASVGYAHREQRNQWGTRNTAVPTEAWGSPVTVTERNSGETVQVWRRPTAASANLFYNSSDLDTNYDGVDLTFSKRMSHRWSLLAGATFSQIKGTTAGGNRNDPNIALNPFDANRPQTNDRPWSYRLSGVHQLPYEVFVSATWMYQAGAPEITTVSVRNDTITLPQGSQTVVVREVGSVRLPTQTTLDLNLRKDIRLGSGQRLIPRLEVFNLLNNSSIQSWITTLGPTYHRPSLIQHGRLWKLEMAYDF